MYLICLYITHCTNTFQLYWVSRPLARGGTVEAKVITKVHLATLQQASGSNRKAWQSVRWRRRRKRRKRRRRRGRRSVVGVAHALVTRVDNHAPTTDNGANWHDADQSSLGCWLVVIWSTDFLLAVAGGRRGRISFSNGSKN